MDKMSFEAIDRMVTDLVRFVEELEESGAGDIMDSMTIRDFVEMAEEEAQKRHTK